MLKTALVGCGNVSRMHFSALAQLGCAGITAVCDIVPGRADAKAKEYGAAAYYDFDDMLTNAGFDVLHICTPHYLHPTMAIAAMEAGKSVFCEKPMAIRLADAAKIRDTAERTGAYFGCCFQNRYNLSYKEVRRAIDTYCPRGRFYPSIPNGVCFREWNNSIFLDELTKYGRQYAVEHPI